MHPQVGEPLAHCAILVLKWSDDMRCIFTAQIFSPYGMVSAFATIDPADATWIANSKLCKKRQQTIAQVGQGTMPK